MPRASLVITTVIVSALSAAATVYLLSPAAVDTDTAEVIESGSQPTLSPATENGAAEQLDSTTEIQKLKQDISRFREQLDDANAERAQLAETVVQLNRQLADLESSTVNLTSLASQQAELNESTATTQGNPNSDNSDVFRFSDEPTAASRFDSLLAAGIDAIAAQDINDRQNRYQLERLEITDLATREGWINTDQYRERLEELSSSRVDLRDELGDDPYDAYLYASGSSNRVLIQSIIPGSAADSAGVQANDIIMSYANTRVYRVRDLQQATRGGSRGEFVDMTLDRQGQSISVSVPRGPLGVSLDALRVSP